MRSPRAKVLHPLGGLPLLAWVLRAVHPAVSRVVVVVGHEREDVAAAARRELPAAMLSVVLQEPQEGTGHALACAAEAIGSAETLLVLNGDVPRLSTAALISLADEHEARGADATVLTFRPDDPAGYGRVVRASDGSVLHVVEHRDATPSERQIAEVNSGTWAFRAAAVLPVLDELPVSRSGERYLTDVVSVLVARGGLVAAAEAPSDEAEGVNTQEQLASLEEAWRRRRARELREAGVTIVEAGTVRVDADVQVGAGTVLEPLVSLEGKSRIGTGCHVGSLVRVVDAQVGDRCSLRGPLLVANGKVEPGSVVGPA